MRSHRRGRSALAVTALFMSTVLVAGCSGGSEGPAETSDPQDTSPAAVGGLPAGAGKDDYIAAFADVDPIILGTQLAGPLGSLTNEARERYLAQVEEWSGGKITFDIAYSLAAAPFAEVPNALKDGRLDIAFASAGYSPDIFPANAMLENVSVAGVGAPIGYMATTGTLTEIASSHPEFREEWEAEGLVPLLWVESGNLAAIFCSEPRDTLAALQGGQIAVSGRVKSAEARALGMEPVSMSYQEQYEGLERGVIDCALSGPQAANTGGIIEVAPHVVMDAPSTFSFTASTLLVAQRVWDELPLVARQLLFDLLPTYIAGTIAQNYATIKVALDVVDAAGGSILELDEPAREALHAANEEILGEIRSSSHFADPDALADAARTTGERWIGRLHDAGYDGWGDSYQGLVDAYSDAEPTIEEFEAYAELVLEAQSSDRPE
ncbi:TRAP transporter substrate-binding protein DctP [Microbacterium sp. No. 7]|uniref:TRAP transporter substrate-binding protein DctP n=1 Tax=Microbacterium sp. No. 7 TaxID=1714373 RepID=UPI0006D2B4F7|nr:TRAP transporter substrate-binding protein DctP [Microbacterium sp. No. 7]ALJ18886.1 hypothetical protein AOA12_02760 [Microbacterium sp. No. 7]